MISDVVIVGVTLENIARGFRYIDVKTTNAFNEEDKHSKIPVLYWTKDDGSKLNRYKKGSNVIIRGRIESDDEIGLYVLAESIYLFNQ